MAAKHEAVVTRVLMEATKRGWRLFKNAMGQAFAGKVTAEYDDSKGRVVELLGAARIRYGVCNPGGSDAIGWQPVTLYKDMIPEGGLKLAVFVAVECKTDGYASLSKEQKQFLGEVRKAGGIALIARRAKDGEGVELEEAKA